MSTDAEKLAKIATALPGPFAIKAQHEQFADEVRAVLAEPGPAVPAHALDRDALLALIGDDIYDTNEQFADRILALVRPVEGGIVLSREEAADMASTLRSEAAIASRPGQYVRLEALAARLEEASS